MTIGLSSLAAPSKSLSIPLFILQQPCCPLSSLSNVPLSLFLLQWSPFPLLLSPLHFLELQQSGSLRFITSVSSSSQSACLLACACGEEESAVATLWESYWAEGLMWCLGLSVSSIILHHFQAAAVVSSVVHSNGWVLKPFKGNETILLFKKYCKMLCAITFNMSQIQQYIKW